MLLDQKIASMTSLKTSPKYTKKGELLVKKGVNGLGLFAGVDIAKGDCIIEYIGEIITDAVANERGGRYLFQTSRNRHIDGTTRENTARYINHACKPNCEIEITKGRVFVYSKRKILKGEELFYDYGEEYFDEYIKPKGCLCATCLAKKAKKESK